MTTKQSNIPIFTTPPKAVKTIGIMKNTTNNQRVISDPTGNMERQLASTVLKRVSFYVPESQCNNISTRVNAYPKDKYINSQAQHESSPNESNSLGSKLGNKIDGVIKMGCKLTNKLDSAIRSNGGKYDLPRFEIKVDSSKPEAKTPDSSKTSNKKKYTCANKAMDLDKNYSLKWDTRVAKLCTPIRNPEGDIVLNNYKVYSNKDGSKKSILHSLKYTSHNPTNSGERDLIKEKWLWDIISNRKTNDCTTSVDYDVKKEEILDGFDLFCQQMAQGGGANLVDLLTNNKNDIQNAELIKDFKGSGNDLLQKGESIYVLPPALSSTCDKNTLDECENNLDFNNNVNEFFIPLGKGIWRWANSTLPCKETKSKYTQTQEDVDGIMLDTSLGPGFEFIYSTNTSEIYQLAFQDNINIAENNIINDKIYNLMSTTESNVD